MVSIRKKKSIADLRTKSVKQEPQSSSQPASSVVEPAVATPGEGQVVSSSPSEYVQGSPRLFAEQEIIAKRSELSLTPPTGDRASNAVHPDTENSAQSLKKRKRISSIERDHDRTRNREWDGDEPLQPPPNKLQSIFRGVYKTGLKWVTHIRVNGNTVYLGAFFSEVEAARLYDRAAYICKRPPNFVMTDEEKNALDKLAWDEFLTKTKQEIAILARQEKKDRNNNSVEPPRRVSHYTGVFSTGRKWVAHIRVDGSTVFLGVVNSEDEASHLFDRIHTILLKLQTKCLSATLRERYPSGRLVPCEMRNGVDQYVHAVDEVKKLKEKSQFRGVYKNNSKWQAGIKVNGKQLHLGTVSTEEAAAHLYDRAAYILGRDTNLPIVTAEKEDLDKMTWEEFIASTKGGMLLKRDCRAKLSGRGGARLKTRGRNTAQCDTEEKREDQPVMVQPEREEVARLSPPVTRRSSIMAGRDRDRECSPAKDSSLRAKRTKTDSAGHGKVQNFDQGSDSSMHFADVNDTANAADDTESRTRWMISCLVEALEQHP
ncbi:hypothetical protein CBR_g38383 [Chara braunii]|uniref:AP2/ERF domain-containing protein n=1 Tax=Chara braunii TaxID=69332 RepID=A0A388JNK4_CHABU|nr:hypothetical protein CBR_g38383 [Chara braunii]|eukprot:GBG59355.1 hypothetical protein CBR_g38383 [Chara braunii]